MVLVAFRFSNAAHPGFIFFWNIRKKERFHNTTMVLLGAFLLEMLQLPHVHHFL